MLGGAYRRLTLRSLRVRLLALGERRFMLAGVLVD